MFIKKITPELQASLEKQGLHKAQGSQRKWISRIKSGMDLIAVGPKNSGKSTSYKVALIQQLKHAVADVPRAMVVCLDKEAVLESEENFNALGAHTDLRFHVGFEGADILKQKNKIYFGTDIVAGSPRRITELMSIEGINFAEIKTLIIDDADELMKNNNMTFIHRITTSLPNAQKAIFTEKITDNITRYRDKYMLSPMKIEETEVISNELTDEEG